MKIKVVPRGNGIAVTSIALSTLLIMTNFDVSVLWLIAAAVINAAAVTLLVAQLVSSKAVFGEETLLLIYGFVRHRMPYTKMRKVAVTKRGILLWHEKKKPWDIWLKDDSKDTFLAELYKHSPSLKEGQEE